MNNRPAFPQREDARAPVWPAWLMDGLNRLIGPELSEGLLGDLAESFFDQYGRFGRRRAQFWLAYEMGRSLPGVAILAVRQSSQRRLRMDPALLSRQTRRLALLGLLVMLPTLLFVASGVLFSLGFPGLSLALEPLPRWIDSPAVILGGIGLGLALNVVPVVSLQLERRPGAVVGTVLLRLSWFNLSLIGLSGLLATVVFVYLLAENLAIFAR